MALVALNYSVDNDQTFALLPLGDVLVANMTEVTPLGFGAAPQDLPGAQQYTANKYSTSRKTSHAQADCFQLRKNGSYFGGQL